MRKIESQKYRDDLFEEIKQEQDKTKRREILSQAKTTGRYQEARKLKLKEVDIMVDTQEALDLEREKIGLEPKAADIITIRQAVEELQNLPKEREPYSLDGAEEEKPLMHYSKGGNIFQILRFGIQSNNFKNRFNELRKDNHVAYDLARQMCGFRIKQGGSYQGKDSVSLSKYQKDLFVRPGNILYLINPEIKTFGGEEEEREKTGYGHGIKKRKVAEEYEVGNPTAYRDEVLAANVVLPKEIKAIVVDKYTRILSDLVETTIENVKIFIQERKNNLKASEDLTANIKLIGELSGSPEIIAEASKLQEDLEDESMTYKEVHSAVSSLQKKALSAFVGKDAKLTEESLREAIEKKFNIQILKKEDKK